MATKQIAITLPEEIIEQVDREAEAEHRNRSNMVAVLTIEAIKARKQSQQPE